MIKCYGEWYAKAQDWLHTPVAGRLHLVLFVIGVVVVVFLEYRRYRRWKDYLASKKE